MTHRMSLRKTGFSSLLLLFSLASQSYAYELEATIIHPDPDRTYDLAGLTIQPETIKVQVQKINGRNRLVAVVTGEYRRNGYRIFSKNHIIEHHTGPNGLPENEKFVTPVPLTAEITPMDFLVQGPGGKQEEQRIEIRFRDWEEASEDLVDLPLTVNTVHDSEGAYRKPISVFPSLGVTYLSYSETGKADFSSVLTTLKVSMQGALVPPSWIYGVTGFVTILPISISHSDATVRFLGLNLRAGYIIQNIGSRWRLSLLGGLYYTTMFVTASNPFGFRNLMGPQLFPVFSKVLNPSDAISFYLKYSPVGGGFAIASSSDREVAGGLGWTRVLANGHSLSTGLDIADLQLLSGANTLDSRTYSLSLGYGL